jgi:hypothetical protein
MSTRGYDLGQDRLFGISAHLTAYLSPDIVLVAIGLSHGQEGNGVSEGK